MNNQYQAFLNYLSKMDIGMLDLILDKQNYSDVPKELFIEKLGEVFKKFKELGNTELILNEGKCNSAECNFGKYGFSYRGNVSDHHLDLVIEENLEDIYHCRSFCTGDPVEKGQQLFLTFYEEDKITFKGTSEHLIKLQQTEKAIEELKQERIITEAYLIYWLNKYHKLSDNTGYEVNSRLTIFTNLYNAITDLESFLKAKPEAIKAAGEYSFLDPDQEDELLEWLFKWEEFSLSNFIDLHYYFPGYFKDGLIKFRNQEIYFTVEDFGSIFTFSDLFDNHYWAMLEKHGKLVPENKEYYGPGLRALVEEYRYIVSKLFQII